LICIEPLRLQVTLPLQVAAVRADLPLLLQTHQGAQTQFHRLPFAKGTGGLHRLPHQGVVSANQRIHTVNTRCDSFGMSLRDIKAERNFHQLEQEVASLSHQAPKARQIAKQAELNFAVKVLRVQLEKARARL
jgi:hypothetical protein